MTDIDSGLEHLRVTDDPPLVPTREGLPPRYRMRADAHYVEQLDSGLDGSPIRFLDTRAIDVPRHEQDAAPAAPFVDSIKRHGVLQPLLVRSRGGRHQLIAGRKRLAAAIAAGLREVPCLVQRADDQQAELLAAASNVPAVDAPVPAPQPQYEPHSDRAFGALTECLTAVASSANLLSSRSPLTHTVAADLVRAESARALQLLLALRVLTTDVAIARRAVSTRVVVERAAEQTGAERRLRGIDMHVVVDGMNTTLRGDEDLLVGAVAGLLTTMLGFIDGASARTIAVRAGSQPDARVAVSVLHESVETASRWRAALAEPEAMTILHAARRIAELHGGQIAVESSDGVSGASLVVAGNRAE